MRALLFGARNELFRDPLLALTNTGEMAEWSKARPC
jgi:hypothetical protein